MINALFAFIGGAGLIIIYVLFILLFIIPLIFLLFTIVFIILQVGIYLIFTGVWIFSFQIWGVVDNGEWAPVSLIDFIRNVQFSTSLSDWATNPQSLIGIHNVASSLNGGFSIFIFGASIIFIFLYFIVGNDGRKELREELNITKLISILVVKIKDHPVIYLLSVIASILTIYGFIFN